MMWVPFIFYPQWQIASRFPVKALLLQDSFASDEIETYLGEHHRLWQ